MKFQPTNVTHVSPYIFYKPFRPYDQDYRRRSCSASRSALKKKREERKNEKKAKQEKEKKCEGSRELILLGQERQQLLHVEGHDLDSSIALLIV
jgi:hypothetical protein